ncbi:MAG: pyridoxal phosphate-dependent aminotransferase [Acidobacteria bacterium]|nr:pyridoxal phosphate-dependent aminotransferase [Acidobacteriota bacterium]
MFSGRLPPHAEQNALSTALAALQAQGASIVDLTDSNPTHTAIPYPDDLLASLGDSEGLRYEPHPFGLPAARAAVAADQRRRGALVDPARVVLTSSSSEAYSWLFKLLCNPGEGVLVPQPSYPLFEHLTALDGVRMHPYALEYHGRWAIDIDAIAAAPADVRAVLVVSPNNPTGSYIDEDELRRLSAVCRERRWALIADEVFADYPLDVTDPLTDIAARDQVLSFTLAGLSKSVGLPQLKLGWCIVGGPPRERDAALAALELIADSYLSVGTPVQLALPALLDVGSRVRSAIQERIRVNLAALHAVVRGFPACDLLRTEGGWSAVVRVPATRTEEQLALDLLGAERILVHPGYFFGFPRESHLVVSLLPPPDVFESAIARMLTFGNG